MIVLKVDDVNEAYFRGLPIIFGAGEPQPSRAGEVLVLSSPLTIVYAKPQQRVLLDPGRDANPFFHLFESLWILAGRQDATWLDRFVHDFSSRFAEEDGKQHGAYGYRWRRHFDMEGGGHRNLPDQLETVVHLLTINPYDRRAVITMWDPVADLGADKKDIPCNTQIYLRIREEFLRPGTADSNVNVFARESYRKVLDITVCCRSNDFVWGMTGANAVHFSFLQEYLAGRIGVGIGKYYQIANNAHVYVATMPRVHPTWGLYPGIQPIGREWSSWDRDLASFMEWTASEEPDQEPQEYPNNPWFHETAEPLFVAHSFWKQGAHEEAMAIVDNPDFDIAPDWRAACLAWMRRRIERKAQKETV